MWRRDHYAEVLLQAGVGAAIPYLKERSKAAADASAGLSRPARTVNAFARLTKAFGFLVFSIASKAIQALEKMAAKAPRAFAVRQGLGDNSPVGKGEAEATPSPLSQ